MSLGLSYSLFDQQGLERLKAAVGKSFYFSDRKVTLNDGELANAINNAFFEKAARLLLPHSSRLSRKMLIGE